MKTDIFDIKGKKTGTVELPENVFGLPWNDALVHQVIVSMQSNARTNVAHTKGRGDVPTHVALQPILVNVAIPARVGYRMVITSEHAHSNFP